MDDKYQIILTTCPDKQSANNLAQLLVKQRLAACVNIFDGVSSVYRWQSKIETEQESLLFIKSIKSRYTQIEHVIRSNHPYELPEIITVPITMGLPKYLSWIEKNVSTSTD